MHTHTHTQSSLCLDKWGQGCHTLPSGVPCCVKPICGHHWALEQMGYLTLEGKVTASFSPSCVLPPCYFTFPCYISVCTKHHDNHFIGVMSLQYLTLFYKWWHWVSQKLNYFLKSQLITSKIKFKHKLVSLRTLCSWPLIFSPSQIYPHLWT